MSTTVVRSTTVGPALVVSVANVGPSVPMTVVRAPHRGAGSTHLFAALIASSMTL